MTHLKHKHSRIGLKLIASVALTIIIVISIYSYFSLHSQSQLLFTEFERHANQLSEIIKKSTRTSMMLNERDRIYRIINTIGGEKCIRGIRIFNKEGEIIYSKDSTQIGTMVNKQAESCFACHAADKPLEKLSINERTRTFKLHPDSSSIMGVMNPIYNEPSCWNADCHVHPEEQKVLGVLDITICLKQLDEAEKAGTIRVVVFAITSVLLLSLIIGFFVRQWIHNPINALLQATHEIGSGNLNYTVPELGNDEFGILGRAFNRMTNKLAEARMQLFQSDKMASLGRLAAGVAHEINNPLTGVLTYSSFLLKRTKDMPEIHRDLEVIVRETMRSREIVKGLLDFARQSVPKKNEANVNEIIENAISVVSNQLQMKHINVTKNLDANLPFIVADSNQLQQVILNLIVNASDAIEGDNGYIKITTSLIALSPLGISTIRNAVCRKRHNLMDNEIRIDGLSTVKVLATYKDAKGAINLDPVYGKHRHKYFIKVEDGNSIDMFCPRCETSLIDDEIKCPDCGCNVYAIEVPPNGIFKGCTNPACTWEEWKAMDDLGSRNYVEIIIEDNGCGIPKENLERIFEPFFTTKGQKGTGLGLSVIWGIIDNHDGSISVESEVGKGTKFIIRLPAR